MIAEELLVHTSCSKNLEGEHTPRWDLYSLKRCILGNITFPRQVGAALVRGTACEKRSWSSKPHAANNAAHLSTHNNTPDTVLLDC